MDWLNLILLVNSMATVLWGLEEEVISGGALCIVTLTEEAIPT